MVHIVKVEGFEAFQSKVAELAKTGGDVFVMFSGSKDGNGVSWCPDCVDAEPVVNVRIIVKFNRTSDCILGLPELCSRGQPLPVRGGGGQGRLERSELCLPYCKGNTAEKVS